MPEVLFGEYYLTGMREMASGFLIGPDASFEFFFSYGALDRYGSGNWQEKDGQLTFQSRPRPLVDYSLKQSIERNDESICIRISDNNSGILQYVHVSLENGKEGSWHALDNSGEVRLPKQPVKTISLLFEFCPERFSTFNVDDPVLNDFEFGFEPWLFEFFFEGFTLNIKEDALEGKHPMMEGDQFHYRKSSGISNS